MSSIVWVAFCGDCDHQLTEYEARKEFCPECEANAFANGEIYEVAQ